MRPTPTGQCHGRRSRQNGHRTRHAGAARPPERTPRSVAQPQPGHPTGHRTVSWPAQAGHPRLPAGPSVIHQSGSLAPERLVGPCSSPARSNASVFHPPETMSLRWRCSGAGRGGSAQSRQTTLEGPHQWRMAMTDGSITRRGVMVAAAGGVALTTTTAFATDAVPVHRPGRDLPPGGTLPVKLRVNDETLELRVDPRTSLLDALREQAGLTGTKKGCDRGACGACTVHHRRPAGHLLPDPGGALPGQADHDDRRSWPQAGDLHPVQAAFLEHDGLQCGYCTPGQIMSAVGADQGRPRPLRRRNPRVDERQYLSLRRLSQHRRRRPRRQLREA